MANRQQQQEAREIDMGDIMTRLEQPEQAADLSALEANEVKARNDEIAWLVEQTQATEAKLQHLQRLTTIAANEKTMQIRSICLRHDLDVDRNDYELDTDQGVIMLVATKQKLTPQLMAPEEQAAENGVGQEN